ncbi:unnamed protein product [Mytilus coruscus]|uniref:B box-type domain-containing protein n=1 Tax=Mytilus coruscus TaxID=42192 RepID=A0A6J8CNZ7_MYTCO|nr:unnamed protein product [Mytilus coruscus]
MELLPKDLQELHKRFDQVITEEYYAKVEEMNILMKAHKYMYKELQRQQEEFRKANGFKTKLPEIQFVSHKRAQHIMKEELSVTTKEQRNNNKIEEMKMDCVYFPDIYSITSVAQRTFDQIKTSEYYAKVEDMNKLQRIHTYIYKEFQRQQEEFHTATGYKAKLPDVQFVNYKSAIQIMNEQPFEATKEQRNYNRMVVKLKVATDERKYTENMPTSSTCVEHTSEEIRFFCEECHVFVCDDCVSGQGKHIRCTKVKLSEYGNKNKLCLIENVEEITSKKLPHIKRTLELAKNVKGSFNKSMDENITDFRSNTQKIKAIIDELQEETIRGLEESRLKANVKFDEFISFHQNRYSKLAHVTEEIQQQKADIQPSDVVKYDFELKKNLNTEHDLKPSRNSNHLHIKEDEKTEYNTNKLEKEERNSSPDYLEPVSHAREINLGCTVNEKIIIKNYEENSSDIYVSKSANKGAPAIYNKDLNYKIIKKFECKKAVTFIVPKTNVYEAWVIGMDISEINLKQPEPQFTTLLPHIDGEPFTAGNSKKHGLLIGLKNRKSIKLLQEMTGTQKRTSVMYKLVSHIPAHSQHLSAICTLSTPEKTKISLFFYMPTI